MTSLFRAAEPSPVVSFDGIIGSISHLPTERCWGFVAGVYRHIASPPLGHPSSHRAMLRHRRGWGATRSEPFTYIVYDSYWLAHIDIHQFSILFLDRTVGSLPAPSIWSRSIMTQFNLDYTRSVGPIGRLFAGRTIIHWRLLRLMQRGNTSNFLTPMGASPPPGPPSLLQNDAGASSRTVIDLHRWTENDNWPLTLTERCRGIVANRSTAKWAIRVYRLCCTLAHIDPQQFSILFLDRTAGPPPPFISSGGPPK